MNNRFLYIYTLLVICIVSICSACTNQKQNISIHDNQTELTKKIGSVVSAIGKNIDYILHDSHNILWFASNSDGVYRYNGKVLTHITEKEGLISNFVLKIEEDIQGNIWFSTRDGICTFDGMSFKNYTDTIKNAPFRTISYVKGGLFFSNLNSICFFDGSQFSNFTIHPFSYSPPNHTLYRPYGMYCSLVDNKHKIVFGTQDKGVCFYQKEQSTFITDKDLAGPAIRSIIQDKKGHYWFGNNGGGLFLYDGNILRNLTEEFQLTNYDFLRDHSQKEKEGTLARVFAIQQDKFEHMWIGTADAGIWEYDGVSMKNYTSKDGVIGNSVTYIYKDKNEKLWFIVNGDSFQYFDGKSFQKANFSELY